MPLLCFAKDVTKSPECSRMQTNSPDGFLLEVVLAKLDILAQVKSQGVKSEEIVLKNIISKFGRTRISYFKFNNILCELTHVLT